VDAPGFSHATGAEWMSLRFRRTRRRRFTALHAAVDTASLMVHAVRVKARPGGDNRHLVALIRRVNPANLQVVYGDRAYISRENVQYISDLGAYAAIEPRRNARIRASSHLAYKELVKDYQSSPERRKESHEYGQRSLAETVFSMMKLKFSGGLKSRDLIWGV